MKDYRSLNHTKWDCKYDVVFFPKRRKKQIYGAIRKHLGDIYNDLASVQGVKYSRRAPVHGARPHVCEHSSEIYGVQCDWYINGKSPISIARNFTSRKRNFTGENFWARGYYVSTVGLDEESVKRYIQMLHPEAPPARGS